MTKAVLEPAVEKRLNVIGKINIDGKKGVTISCTREEIEQFLAQEISIVRKEEREKILNRMNSFEKTNPLLEARIVGWSFVKELLNTSQGKDL